MARGKPIIVFRKKIILSAKPYKVNKDSYLKKGSAIAKSRKEDHLFDNMFEVLLNEEYEDNYNYRKLEWAKKIRQEREKWQDWIKNQKLRRR